MTARRPVRKPDTSKAFTPAERKRIAQEWAELSPGTTPEPAYAAMHKLSAQVDPFSLAQLRRWRQDDVHIIGVDSRGGPIFGKLSS